MSEQNIIVKPIINRIKFFIKHYVTEKYNLRIDKFNKKNKVLTVAYREYIKQYIPIHNTYCTEDVKITQFKIEIQLNNNCNKIDNLKFIHNNKELYIVVNKTIKDKLINKLEKDLKTVISYKKSSIKSIIDYNNFIKIFTSKINTNDEEKLSLLCTATDYFDKTISNSLYL